MHVRTLIWIAAMALSSSSLVAGEASVAESFRVNATYGEVVRWLEANQSACRDAMSIRLESQDGPVLTLSRQNRRGRWVWKQRDVITNTPDRWHIESTLVECMVGGIQAFASDAVIAADGERTLVSATSTLKVDDVSSKELKIDLHGRARRLRELLEREVAR